MPLGIEMNLKLTLQSPDCRLRSSLTAYES